MSKLSFYFKEESDYGQDILELMAMVADLMDENKVYQKTKTKQDLHQIKMRAQSIINKLTLGYIDDKQYVGLKGVE